MAGHFTSYSRILIIAYQTSDIDKCKSDISHNDILFRYMISNIRYLI